MVLWGKLIQKEILVYLLSISPREVPANGIRFGQDQSMYLADYTGHNVLKVNLKTKAVSVYAHDSLLNQPNDLAICCNDRMFASDPNWKESTGQLLEGRKWPILSSIQRYGND